MLPSKRRKKALLIILGSLIALIVIILGSMALTKIAQEQKRVFKSDKYPNNIKYIGITKDNENEYYFLKPLTSNFQVSKYSIRSFLEIKDYYVLNNELLIYSDAVNELAYNKKEDNFSLKEINSFYNNLDDIIITKDYLVIKDFNNNLKYQNLLKENDDFTLIAENILDSPIYKKDNTVYFMTKEGLNSYALELKEQQLLLPLEEEATILASSDNYLYIKSSKETYIYDLKNNTARYLEDFSKLLIAIDNEGIIYLEDSNLKHYNLEEKISQDIYNLADNQLVKIEVINSNYYYIEITKDNNYKYFIYDRKQKKIVQELTEAYLNIIEVK